MNSNNFVKVLKIDENSQYYREVNINIFLRNKNISPNMLLYNVNNNECYMEFEKCNFDLRFFINNYELDIELIEIIIEKLIYLILTLHKYNIAHCDIKPENILVNYKNNKDFQLLLCDFGISCLIDKNKDDKYYYSQKITNDRDLFKNNFSFKKEINYKFEINKILGTNGYSSYEQLLGLEIDENIDFWALGCIIIELLQKLKYPNRNSIPYFKNNESINFNDYLYLENDNQNENIGFINSIKNKSKSVILLENDPIIKIPKLLGYENFAFYTHLNVNSDIKILINYIYNILVKYDYDSSLEDLFDNKLNNKFIYLMLTGFLNFNPKARKECIKNYIENFNNNHFDNSFMTMKNINFN